MKRNPIPIAIWRAVHEVIYIEFPITEISYYKCMLLEWREQGKCYRAIIQIINTFSDARWKWLRKAIWQGNQIQCIRFLGAAVSSCKNDLIISGACKG